MSLFDGKPHPVGKLPKSGSAFLGLAVALNTTGKPASDENVNWTLDKLNVNFDIAEGQTVSLALPFSLWPIHLSGAGSLQDAALAAYSITLTSPWTNFLEDDDTIGKPQTVVPATKAGGSADFFVIVDDKTAQVSGSASFCDASGECVIHHAFSLSGPGSYDVTATGLVGPTP